ncbi:twin arginine targeting (Tat) protein translocase TatC [Abditibacterium utsteinense]|uniref:Sec-independent protein translocase protein TatC n=1 Tax=Abditibacterium utsteinense TaxID=1960156 RepID=A0A2S8SWB2_9BACT|nr:twin-arginine translocase subunit TatC [Abditibacterium utsteinense]PQV65078.1 twin arginine targeting (Tat) protein translocase TatC [Abditibacterium utsteinense]
MPDISSNGFPNGSTDGSPNGQSANEDSIPEDSINEQSAELPAAPRIAPPEGARAARGAFIDSLDSEETSEAAVFKAAQGNVDSPAVEDSYAPLDIHSIDLDSGDINSGFASDSSNYEDPPGFLSGKARPDTPKDVELGLMAHLGELRQRLLYCAIILMVGMTLTWNYSQPMQEWFAEPIRNAIGKKGVIQSTDPTGFFMITVQFSLISALIITAPLLFWQVWLFIEPALTKAERRYSLIIVPFASALFFTGAGLSYLVSPLFFKFFLAFQPNGVAANWDYGKSVVLMAQMLLAFGVMFQVPVIVIFLNKLGLLSRNVLIDYWRHAVIVIFVVAAIVTPTWDPVTLMVCATPPCLLYVLSIWLVKWL